MSVHEMSSGAFEAEQVDLLRSALAALRTASTVAELGEELLARELVVTGATAGVVVLLTDDGTALDLVASTGYDPRDLEGWDRSPLTERFPLHDAVREDRVVFVGSLDELGRSYPQVRPFDGRHHALAGLPLRAGGGEVIGGVGLRFDVHPAAAAEVADELVAGELLAAAAGERIQHGRLVGGLRDRVEQLQQALDTRVVVEQAKGVLVERHGITPAEAFERIRRYARSHRLRVQAVALEVIAGSLDP